MGEISCILRVMKFADETYQISPRQIEDNRPEKYLCYANETRVVARRRRGEMQFADEKY